MVEVIEIISYLLMVVSLISCKIVGLELFGILQLSYFTMYSHNVRVLYLEPLIKFNVFNGFNYKAYRGDTGNIGDWKLGELGVDQGFLNNVNIMLLLWVLGLFIGLIFIFLYNITRITFLKTLGQRFCKQVLVTFTLFNLYNVCYSTGF